jgi:hypothetical protein
MPVGSSGVADYTNTTTASAVEVVATGGIGGSGVVAQYGAPPDTYIVTDSGSYLVTDSGLFLVT